MRGVAKIGYGRVSTREQNPEAQVDVLRQAGCERIFIDRASGQLAATGAGQGARLRTVR
jgi:DNA invertase Pin-like site-specific DNA recombinase